MNLNGVKFFQTDLNFLELYRAEHFEGQRLTAATLATYLLFHFHCDDFGRVREDELVLKHITEKHQLPYTSIHNGYHALFEIGLLERQIINDKAYIAIKTFEANNSPSINGSMNYFTLPYQLLNSGILSDFIKARDVSGLMGLMHLLNSLTREFKRSKKRNYALKFSSILRIAHKTKRNVTDWLNRLVRLIGHEEKEPTTAAATATNEKQLNFSFVDECFENAEYDDQKVRLYGALRKEMNCMLLSLQVPYAGKDARDAVRVMAQDCLDVFYPITTIEGGIRELRWLMQESIKLVKNFLDIRTGDKIKNFGGFFRTVVRPILNEQCEQLTLESKLALKMDSLNTNKPLPQFLSASKTLV